MKTSGISFHHPFAFWFGCLLVLAGVLAHAPMFMMGQHTHWQMVGMPMSTEMWIGMALIPVGLALSMYGLMPRMEQMRNTAQRARDHRYFHIADGVPLNRAHWTLVIVLIVALAVDVMKPAT